MIVYFLMACGLSSVESPIQSQKPIQTTKVIEKKTPAQNRFRQCTTDSECTVVYAIAGLDVIINDPTSATCGDLCFTAISKKHVIEWEKARTKLQSTIPCHKKRAKCGSIQAREARCLQNQCAVMPLKR